MSNESSNRAEAEVIDPRGPVVVAHGDAVEGLDRWNPHMGEVVFEILVAVMWSDGELVRAEVERGRAAAEVMQIRPARGGALGAIADGPILFSAIAFDTLDNASRHLAYAAACWLDEASEDPSARRHGFIGQLRTRLALPDHVAAWLQQLAAEAGERHDDPREAFRYLMERVSQSPE